MFVHLQNVLIVVAIVMSAVPVPAQNSQTVGPDRSAGNAGGRGQPVFQGRVYLGNDGIETDSLGWTLLVGGRPATGLEADNFREVPVSVLTLPDAVLATGLTREQVQTEVEERLRMAGLDPVAGESRPLGPALGVRISGLANAFGIDLSFMRVVPFVAETDRSQAASTYPVRTVWAPTWSNGITGLHGGKADFIVNALDGQLDAFLEAYLEANAPAPQASEQ